MNFVNQENTIQLIISFFINIFKNKLLVNTILLFWIGSVLLFVSFIFYIKIIKQRNLIGNNKDIKDGNIPFINYDKLKEVIIM
jgi:hypothetical protein